MNNRTAGYSYSCQSGRALFSETTTIHDHVPYSPEPESPMMSVVCDVKTLHQDLSGDTGWMGLV